MASQREILAGYPWVKSEMTRQAYNTVALSSSVMLYGFQAWPQTCCPINFIRLQTLGYQAVPLFTYCMVGILID